VTAAIVLAVAPATASTELALFRGPQPLAHETARHAAARASRGSRGEQLAISADAARAFLARAGIGRGGLAAVAGRGRLPRAHEAGTYLVDDAVLRDVQRADGEPGGLGARLARMVAEEHGCPAFMVDARPEGELDALARFSGLAGVARASACDALAVRAAALRHARSAERELEELSLVVAHLGAATSIAALRAGRIVDASGPLDDGPFSGASCGALPVAAVLDLCFAPGADRAAVERQLHADGGLFSYLGTRDPRAAAERAERGDAAALIVLEAMAYQVSKAVGELAVALGGEVDAIVLAGAAASAAPLVAAVCRRVEWIAPVFVQACDAELSAVADAALRALSGEEPALRYGLPPGGPSSGGGGGGSERSRCQRQNIQTAADTATATASASSTWCTR
jgi:butyrate kinase